MAKIMLVEDDNNLRAIYGDRLMAEGHEIVSARDGEEALAVAVKEKPDLIISDVMMPKISGFDMLDILRSTPETKDTKVIMMTALSQAEDKERANTLGADKYLVKSQVTLDDVARVVNEVLGGQTPANDTNLAPGVTSSVPSMTSAPVANNSTPPAQPIGSTPMPEPQVTPVVSPPTTSAPMPTPAADPLTDSPVVQSVPLPEPVSTPISSTPAVNPEPPLQSASQSVVPDSDSLATGAVFSDAESSAEEQQDVSEQIENFVTSNVPDSPAPTDETTATPVSVAPETPAVSPSNEVPVTEPQSQPMAVEPTPNASAPEVPPQETQDQIPVSRVEVTDESEPKALAGQKVIEPLQEQINKPNIHELYEKEMAAEAANVPVTNPGSGTVINPPQAAPEVHAAPPAAVETPAPSSNPNDPNNIAL